LKLKGPLWEKWTT